MICDFCGRDKDEVAYLVESPTGARICDECAIKSVTMLIQNADDGKEALDYENRRLRDRNEGGDEMKDKKEFDLCEYCCDWANDHMGKSPVTVADDYPKMMRKVLREFGMGKGAANTFIDEACEGNWSKLHTTTIEEAALPKLYAEKIVGDVFYSSDRWSWDRVLRVQWLYRRLMWKLAHDVFSE